MPAVPHGVVLSTFWVTALRAVVELSHWDSSESSPSTIFMMPSRNSGGTRKPPSSPTPSFMPSVFIEAGVGALVAHRGAADAGGELAEMAEAAGAGVDAGLRGDGAAGAVLRLGRRAAAGVGRGRRGGAGGNLPVELLGVRAVRLDRGDLFVGEVALFGGGEDRLGRGLELLPALAERFDRDRRHENDAGRNGERGNGSRARQQSGLAHYGGLHLGDAAPHDAAISRCPSGG
jgi:hypothetical protein